MFIFSFNFFLSLFDLNSILLEHLSDNYNRRLRSLKNMRELLYHFNEQSENQLKKQAKSTTQKEAKYKKTGKQSVNDAELNRKLNALSAVSPFIFFLFKTVFKRSIVVYFEAYYHNASLYETKMLFKVNSNRIGVD